MEENKILISSKPIEISEFKDYKTATFLISVLDEWDLNQRLIPKDVGAANYQSIIGFPIVAKLVYSPVTGKPIDFAGHEMYIKTEENGEKSVRFGTQPIGSVTDAWIEDREVSGYEGVKSCILIKTKLWSSRFPEYFKVLDDLWQKDKVCSSWELSLSEVEQTAKGRIIKAFSFIGNCLLGSSVLGAVPSAGIYEYAEVDLDENEIQLATALSNDMAVSYTISKEQEEQNLNKDEISEVVDTVDNVDETLVDNETETEEAKKKKKGCATEDKTDPEVSALTEWDLRNKLNAACKAKLDKWCWVSFHFPVDKAVWVEVEGRASEMDYTAFTYTVDNDEVTVSEPTEVKLTVTVAELNSVIAQKDEALITANEQINTLKDEIASMQPFKEAFEKAEQERITAELETKRAELKTKVEKSNLFTAEELESDDIKTLISNANEDAIKKLVADKFMASLDKVEIRKKDAEIETSAVKETIKQPKANLENNDDDQNFSIKEMLKLM